MRTVWAKNRLEHNDELCFTATLEKAENVTMKIVGRDVFNLYVNGQFILYGPARAGHGYLRVEEVDLTPYLTQEINYIALDVICYYTKSLAVTTEKPVVGIEIYAGETLLKDAADFTIREMTDRVRKTERMSSQRGFVESYKQTFDRSEFFSGNFDLFPALESVEVPCPKLLPRRVHQFGYEPCSARKGREYRVRYVESKTPWDCDLTKLLDTGGESLFAFNRSECEVVHTYIFDSFKETRRQDAPARAEVWDFRRDRTGRFRIKVKAATDAKIYLVYDEVLTNGDVLYCREDIIHGMSWAIGAGEYELCSFEPYTCRYVKLVIEGDVEIAYVEMTTIENADTGRFQFDCTDKTLHKIILAAQHSLEQNASDILTDCPSRERSGWLCDSYFSAQAEHLFTGKNRVEYNHLENYCLYNGMENMRPYVLPMCYPSESRSGNFIPNWMCWLVFEIAEYQSRTCDDSLAELTKEKVGDIIKFFSQYENEKGLLEDLPGWIFVEWSRANDFVNGVNFPSNMLYSATLEAAGKFLGVPEYEEKGRKIKAIIREMSYNGEFFADHAIRVDGELVVQEDFSETCQYYAIFFGLADAKRDPEFVKKMMECFGFTRDDEKVYPHVYKSNMFIGNFIRLLILSKERYYERLVAECKLFFSVMAKTTSSLWENRVVRDDLKYHIRGSCCHGFASSVAKFLVEALTGYRGFDEAQKIIYFSSFNLDISCEFTLPIGDHDFCLIENVRGKVTVSLPKGYRLSYE